MPMPVSVTIRNTEDSLPEVRMISRPPVGIASRAFTARFINTCSSCERSPNTGSGAGVVSMHQLDVLADQPAHQPPDFANDDVDVEHFGPEHLLAAEGQELPRQQAGAMRGALDLVEILGAEIGGVERRRHQLGVAGDDGQQVVEVVRDAAGEPADGFHLHRLRQLLLRLLELAAAS